MSTYVSDEPTIDVSSKTAARGFKCTTYCEKWWLWQTTFDVYVEFL